MLHSLTCPTLSLPDRPCHSLLRRRVPVPFFVATLAPCLAILSLTPALLAFVPPCLLLRCLLFYQLLRDSVCVACLFLLGDPSRVCSLLCLSLSLSLSLTLFACLYSLTARCPWQVTAKVNDDKQASRERERERDVERQAEQSATKGSASRNKRAKQTAAPKQQAEPQATAAKDAMGQTRAEKGVGGGGRTGRE